MAVLFVHVTSGSVSLLMSCHFCGDVCVMTCDLSGVF